MFALFVCHGDFEVAWIAAVCADGEREMAEWERQEDLDHEEDLARECVADDEVDDWPWYAEPPLEVEEPEIIEGALDLPAEAEEPYEDDETPIGFMDYADELR